MKALNPSKIRENIESMITPQAVYFKNHNDTLSKQEFLEELDKINFIDAISFQENQAMIITTITHHIQIKPLTQTDKQFWIKEAPFKKRYRMDVSYDGSFYVGSQKQVESKSTIQGTLERVLQHLFQENIQVHFASRTDKGVHAFQNVAHFDASREVDLNTYLNVINKMLPYDITVTLLKETSIFFHARFDVLSKTYLYKLTVYNDLKDVHKKKWVPSLNLDLLKEKSRLFIGTHDFKNFCKNGDYDSTVRTIQSIDVIKTDQGINIKIIGKGFLRYMIRMMVGALIKHDVSTIQEGLNNPSKDISKHVFDAYALYLKAIDY